MILFGSSNSICVGFVSEEWGVATRAAYRLLKRAWESIRNNVDQVGIDTCSCWRCRFTGFKQRLRRVFQGNAGASVAAVRELNHLCGLGSYAHEVHRR